ncbi:hypothetical protein Tco_0190626 [Tanacetum coccineum]
MGTPTLVCVRSCPNLVLQLVGPLGATSLKIVQGYCKDLVVRVFRLACWRIRGFDLRYVIIEMCELNIEYDWERMRIYVWWPTEIFYIYVFSVPPTNVPISSPRIDNDLATDDELAVLAAYCRNHKEGERVDELGRWRKGFKDLGNMISMLTNECHEMQKLETKLWNHAMVRAGHAAYTDRFHELARLVPHLVTLESRKIKRYMYGLALQIHRMVVATELKTMQKAMQISGALTDEPI